eukprot:Em0044g24a
MEVSLVRSRQTREITGPTPHSVAIRAKPVAQHPKEFLILERRKKEELRDAADTIVHYNKHFDLRTKWEQSTDKKIETGTIKRRVESLLKQQQLSVEERRDKLSELLKAEEEMYTGELSNMKETPLERQARMRERAKVLKEAREKERLALVEEKLEQKWSDQCEELRAVITKMNQDEICKERAQQLKLKAELKQREVEEERLYAELWEQDWQAKCKREEMEAALQIERNAEMLKVLTLQSEAMEQHKRLMKQLKDEETQLLKEESALRALEEQRMQEEKRHKQEETKAMLDYSVKLKMKRKAKDVQEELAMDMKILEQMLAESNNEAKEELEKKNRLRDEIHKYKQYLADQTRVEKERDEELEKMLNAEVNRQWEKRFEQWRKEKEARTSLMKQVFDTRRQQIENKMAVVAEEKKRSMEERDLLLKNLKEQEILDKQAMEDKLKSVKAYQQDLLQQMKFQHDLRQSEAERAIQELAMAQNEEILYKQRFQSALETQWSKKMHPKRASNVHSKQ